MTSVLLSLLLSSSGFQLKNAFHRFERHDIDFATGDIFSPSQLTCTLLHPLVSRKNLLWWFVNSKFAALDVFNVTIMFQST